MARKGVIIQDLKCVMCLEEEENPDHIFLQCQYVRNIWRSITHNLQISKLPSRVNKLLSSWREININNNVKTEWDVPILAIQWYIWFERNQRIFNHKQKSSLSVLIAINSFATSEFTCQKSG